MALGGIALAGANALACRAASDLLPGLASTPPIEAAPSATPRTSVSTPAATLGPTPGPIANLGDSQEQGLLPDFASDLSAAEGATRYLLQVSVDFDPESQRARLEGIARILITNREDRAWDDLPLMLWPNDPQYRSSMTVGAALVDGEKVVPQSDLGGLAVRIELPRPLPPGQSLDLSLPFTVEAGGPIGEARPYRFGITQGVFVAPTFYPLVPRRLDGRWQVAAAPPNGDTTNSDVSLYRLRIEAPAGYALAVSGVEIAREEEGESQTVEFVTGPMRDVAFALGDLVMESRAAGPVSVRVWLLPEHAGEMDEILRAAAFQTSLLAERVGPYPYPELDVVDAPGAFGGIEYPGLVFIGTVGGADAISPTVHEVAHQWFYGLIGNDQLREPWLDEAAATYSEVLYDEERYGQGRATGLLSEYRAWLRLDPEAETPIGLPVDRYPGVSDYGLFVYLKGALFFDALRTELGDEAFFSFLQEYYDRFAYGFADAAGFQAEAEDECGCDLEALFDLWVHDGGPLPGP